MPHTKSTLPTSGNNSGFSLLNIMIAIAVVAILAGALGPMVFRQVLKARELETLNEMKTVKAACLNFFHDTGRFPTEAEGIAILITDPGTELWQGPYLTGESQATLEKYFTDEFGRDYIIDLSPTTNPTGTSDMILISSGMDQQFTAGTLNSTWNLNDDGDDLIIIVDSGPLDRDKAMRVQDEIQALATAARQYFYDQAAFPTTLDLLNETYLNSTFHGSVFVDQWFNNYLVSVDNSAHPPVMIIRSSGPNLTDDAGAGDDISHNVDSIGPGRESTQYMLNIIQGSVDNNASTDLTGNWVADAESFNMGDAFINDGWGHPYEEAMSSRTILSGGPDADYFTAADNIPAGVVPDDDGGIEPWDSHGSYTIGDVVSHEGSHWECLQSHDGAGDPNWAPGIAHSLWSSIES